MKSAEDRFRHDLAEPLDRSRQRRILDGLRLDNRDCVLAFNTAGNKR